MPELPDIEGYRRLVNMHVHGARIERIEVRNATVLRGGDGRELTHLLCGRQVGATTRHGKWLFAATDGPTLVIHCGMTGGLRWASADTALRPVDRVVIDVGHGRLIYSDRRNLGTIAVASTDGDRDALTGPLGLDALDVSAADLGAILHASRRSLKATLIDQSAIAGLGNMLTDEITWHARLDPARPARSLSDREVVRLHLAKRDVLRRAGRAGHIPRGPTWLSSQRNADEPTCPRCRGELHRRTLSGRTSLWCARCQGAPSPGLT